MEDFQVVHRFKTLANRGYVTPLSCSQCNQEFTIRLGENDEPDVHCYTCGYSSGIGLSTILLMTRVIRNYEARRA